MEKFAVYNFNYEVKKSNDYAISLFLKKNTIFLVFLSMQINIVNQLKSVDFSMAKNLTLIFLFIGEMEAYQFLLCIYLKVETITFKVGFFFMK